MVVRKGLDGVQYLFHRGHIWRPCRPGSSESRGESDNTSPIVGVDKSENHLLGKCTPVSPIRA